MEDAALLKKLDIFNGLNTFEITQISKLTMRSVYKAGEEIVKEGEPCDAIFIIKEGAVKVIKDKGHLITIESGGLLGEISYIDRGRRSATLEAEKDSVLITIPLDHLEALMKREKEIAFKVYKSIAAILCERLRDTNDTLLSLIEA